MCRGMLVLLHSWLIKISYSPLPSIVGLYLLFTQFTWSVDPCTLSITVLSSYAVICMILSLVFQLEEIADSDRHFLVNCTGCRYIHVGRKR